MWECGHGGEPVGRLSRRSGAVRDREVERQGRVCSTAAAIVKCSVLTAVLLKG